MPEIATFGSIFLYGEKEYVFLDKTEEIIYVAEILNKEASTRFKNLRTNTAKNSKQSYKLKQNIAYCFVELITKEYTERIAHYGFPQIGDTPETELSLDITGRLCDEDIKELYNEIANNDLAVSGELKERIQKISIR